MNNSGKDRLPVFLSLADRQVHGKHGPVLTLPHHFPAGPDDVCHACAAVIFEIAVMAFPERRRHQHFDVLTDYFLLAIAEKPLA